MRLVAYMLSLIFVGMIVAGSTTVFTSLLLEGERAGFQQAAVMLDTGIVADYVVTDWTPFCDGSLAGGDPMQNQFVMVRATDSDSDGVTDYEERINDVNSGKFNIYSGNVSIQLNNPDGDTVSSMSQSITYTANSSLKWEKLVYGGHHLRFAFIDKLKAGAFSSLSFGYLKMYDWFPWVFDLFGDSGQQGDIHNLTSITSSTGLQFEMTPAVIKWADVHYTIPVIISEGDVTLANEASAMQVHLVDINAKVTFFDIREYITEVSEKWE